MKIIKKKENQIVFTANIDESLANTIRRYIFQIPILAIDEVEISKNDSPLYDETISHRLGLIPLETEKSMKDDYSANLKLNSNKKGIVVSGELKGNVKVVYDEIPITILSEEQEMELVATAKMGRGKEHSKFSPGFMTYRNVLEVKIERDCPQEIIEKFNLGSLKSEGGKIIVEDPSLSDKCEEALEEVRKKGKDCIKINLTDELSIMIESFGQISVQEIFKGSIEELKKDLNSLSKQIDKI